MFSFRLNRIPTGLRTCLQIRKQTGVAQVANISENDLKPISENDLKPISENVEYPKIIDLSFRAQQRRKYEKGQEYIKRQTTVEEKLIAINMPRYYGFPCVMLNENIVYYASLEHAQYLTRTHIMSSSTLPSFYDNIISAETLDQIVNNVRSEIEQVLLLEYSQRDVKRELSSEITSNAEKLQNAKTDFISRQINRILMLELLKKFPHLIETEIDYDPRVEAFWVVGGIESPQSVLRFKRKIEWHKPYAEDPIDRYFQYVGEPCLQLRHELPLREVIPYHESENADYTVPDIRYDPHVFGYHQKLRHGTNIPGFWPGDKREFGLLSYHHCGYMTRRRREYDDEEIALNTQAIKASFAWLHAQACYQGFSTYNDITYPLVTQNVIMNGQWWLFSVYQLNTMLLSNHHIDDNPKRNFYWSTGPMKLFEKIENNEVHGLNDEVLKHLIKMYVNEPQKREEEMKPYLGKHVKVVADIQDEEKRKWLEKTFKHIMACRPRHRLLPEIYNWQQIYIRKFNQRPMESKIEPWQKGKNVLLRRLDDHTPEYIPKSHRPYPRSRQKWKKTFYPQ